MKPKLILAGVFAIVVIEALMLLTQSHHLAKQQTEPTTTVTSTPTTIYVGQTAPQKIIAVSTTTAAGFGDGEPTDAELKASLDKTATPYDAATTSSLKQQAAGAMEAFLIGTNRASYPVLWPLDKSGSDANFKTAIIIGESISTSSDANNAQITVVWKSTDLETTNTPQYSAVYAQKQNGAWQITKITQ